jgi:hypothetical protein
MASGDLHAMRLVVVPDGRPGGTDPGPGTHFCESLDPTMACAAANRAIGTRNGEQLT